MTAPRSASLFALLALPACAGPVLAPDTGPSCDALAGAELVLLETAAATARTEGGLRAIQERVEYPVEARRAFVQGTVLVAFAVGPDGRVACTDAVRPVDARLDAAARRAVRATPFEPLVVDGDTVAFGSTVPIGFRLR